MHRWRELRLAFLNTTEADLGAVLESSKIPPLVVANSMDRSLQTDSCWIAVARLGLHETSPRIFFWEVSRTTYCEAKMYVPLTPFATQGIQAG
mmetsp:Transcript_6293/g.9530  ORF Transcript_6293/g.9530 Transcript_6293/m.9530 type:complete len:93 (+) Transcript_6293:101-379(+)